MSFSIRFLPEPTGTEFGEEVQYGEIVIGTFHERFHASLSLWSDFKYKQSWYQGLRRILGTAMKSCLITSMYDPRKANFIIWWPLYRKDNLVYIQNQMLFLDQLYVPFDEKRPWLSVRNRNTTDEEGNKISEWSRNIADVGPFLDKWQSESIHRENEKPFVGK